MTVVADDMRDGAVRVFCSYAHDDMEFVEHISGQLRALKNVAYWDDRSIDAGDRWQERLRHGLESADIYVFVLSTAWFNSPDCESEFKAALKREQKYGAVIVPFIARPIPFRGTHFANYEAWPVVKKRPTAIERLEDPEEAYAEFALMIHDRAARMRQSRVTQDDAAPQGRDSFGFPLKAEHFVGRTALVDALAHELGDGVVTLVGDPGFGKTALAAEYLRRHSEKYDVVAWLRVERLARDLTSFAAWLEEPATSAESARLAIRSWLETHDRWLLVLDNAAKPGDIDGLLPEHHEGHVIVTSRNFGWGALGRELELDELDLSDAVSYLQLAADAYDHEAAERLAELLECVPLRLVTAARKISADGITLDAYTDRIRRTGGFE